MLRNIGIPGSGEAQIVIIAQTGVGEVWDTVVRIDDSGRSQSDSRGCARGSSRDCSRGNREKQQNSVCCSPDGVYLWSGWTTEGGYRWSGWTTEGAYRRSGWAADGVYRWSG